MIPQPSQSENKRKAHYDSACGDKRQKQEANSNSRPLRKND